MDTSYFKITFSLVKISTLLVLLFVLHNRLYDFDMVTKLLIHGTFICVYSVIFFFPKRVFNNPPILTKLSEFWEGAASKQSEFLDKLPSKQIGWLIILSAGASLFLELILIRWQASLFPFFAFYKNFSLLACFLGLGMGYALAHKPKIPIFVTLMLLAIQVLLLIAVRYGSGGLYVLLFMTPITEETTMGTDTFYTLVSFFGLSYNFSDLMRFVALLFPLYALLATVFLFTALTCLPVGQLAGYLMQKKPKLVAYGYNLFGSILGIIALFILSYLWLPPTIWFVCAGLSLLVFIQYNGASRFIGILSLLIVLVSLSWPVEPEKHRVYSPYQLIERTANRYGLMNILSAGKFYMKTFDLSKENTRREHDEHLQSIAGYYELPYYFAEEVGDTAIVGAGTGNDVAASLRFGAKSVHAVEIDPVIMYLGEKYHPEKPYSNENVLPIVTDARTFFRQTKKKFDMVVYGALDSHSLLSQASNVRVDSFVYTQEGFQEAFDTLKPGGIMSISYANINEKQPPRIYQMMENIEGEKSKPLVYENSYGSIDTIHVITFILRKGKEQISAPLEVISHYNYVDITDRFAEPETVDLPTDDWPFFYMTERVYPSSYIVLLFMILGLTIFLVSRLMDANIDLNCMPFFFLGAGFMLVETKAITELGLMYGNTWYVIAVTIISILSLAFLANYIVMKVKRPMYNIAFIALLGILAGSYYFIVYHDLRSIVMSDVLMTILLTSPMFFSGIIFSQLLEKTKAPISQVMAYNLIGAMFGGALEYNSMYFGFSFLYLIAFGVYGLALLSAFRLSRG